MREAETDKSSSGRQALRRRTHDMNDQLAGLLGDLESVDLAAAALVQQARSRLFEAWTILCAPPGDDEDH